MKVLIFDTETTGLPKTREQAYQKPDNWPHLVSISWVILDSDTNIILTQKSYIVKPLWRIPDDSIAIHKITNEIAHNKGVPLHDVIEDFLSETYDKLVSHNINFDMNVLENAIVWDLGRGGRFIPKSVDCTMIIAQKYCRLPGKKSNIHKFPKLKEMYEFIFKKQPCEDQLHGSLYDTLILTECIQKCDWLRNELGFLKQTIHRRNGVPNSTLSINFSQTD
jgi:DNA polymerase III epsilon subunit-like protein